MMKSAHNHTSFEQVRQALVNNCELALLDVREEHPHAQSHPLFAANFPLARIELNALSGLPRLDVPVVTIDDCEGHAEVAAAKLKKLGYTDVSVFNGGVKAWANSGGELFCDVNVPSKAFGELVESIKHTPSLSAEEVDSLIQRKDDVVIVDARRYDEFHTMNIPTATSVPGGELVLRINTYAPNPKTQIVVNCAGRTRSIIGAQSLINAGVTNPIYALRNGTIGWTLAGKSLEHHQTRRYGFASSASDSNVAKSARSLADRAGVKRASFQEVQNWQNQYGRTTYFLDVRTPEEYTESHLDNWRSAPGGQLVQETEMFAPVRGARIVLTDTDGVRANMAASWLSQMNWDVYVLDSPPIFSAKGAWKPQLPTLPVVPLITPEALAAFGLEKFTIIDISPHSTYVNGHIPGAWYALRSQFKEALAVLPASSHYIITCSTGILSTFAQPELSALVHGEVLVLSGGTSAWIESGFSIIADNPLLASPPIDRYRRPYEGTDNPRSAMQAYLDWEFGLVEQLARDGTHGFKVLI